jgi:transglutaminase-like putative cysteine protease
MATVVSAREPVDQWSNTVTPVFAAITTLCASTALSGVIDGSVWLGHVAIAIIVVAGTGIGLRALRVPILLVGLSQLLALMCLVVALFTTKGILGFFPSPGAVDQIGDVLRGAVTVVQTGVPPVDPTTPILCLVVIAIGLVAVLVDSLAVAAGTPAASGLVLLCVYAVPASLADEMLPWWSFVLGGASYAILLAVDGTHRHQQWRSRSGRSNGNGGSSFAAPAALVSAALLLALVFGSLFTVIGTVGQLPGNAGAGGVGTDGFSLKAFTSLRGMLNQRGNEEMFRIRGLPDDKRYLRATTLKQYKANEGWGIGPGMPSGNQLTGELPLEPGRTADGQTTRIQVEPVKSDDNWAPVYGSPRRIEGITGDVRYDESSGAVYVLRKRKFPTYVEYADLAQPTYEQLRASSSAGSEVGSTYLDLPPLNPRITQLARQLTTGKTNQWDKVLALKNYFANENGFQYRTQTAQASNEDALVDFLFQGKVGYCEQYASAMAVLVRAAGIPARVAIGYTSGFQMTDYRSVTTQDAHAWVEVYFPQFGWITVDPTPLSDGRGYVPPYMSPQASTTGRAPTDETSSTAKPQSEATQKKDTPAINDPAQNQQDNAPKEDPYLWVKWTLGGFGALATAGTIWLFISRPKGGGTADSPAAAAGPRKRWLGAVAMVTGLLWLLAVVAACALVSWWLAVPVGLLGLAAFPAFTRIWRRRNNLHSVAAREANSAEAAWQELLAESWDRGATIPDTDTVRMTARRLVREHSLDDEGRDGLRTVVGVIERTWYGGTAEADPELPQAVENVRQSMRRNAPLALRAKLLPRSVLSPRKHRTTTDD